MDKLRNNLTYQYKFILGNGIEKEFIIELDKNTLNLQTHSDKLLPSWTALEYHQCSICTLDPQESAFCPVAVNLVDLVEFFQMSASYEKIELHIETEARNFAKKTSLQQGISSLIGIYMVTSGCPVMDNLKPMVRFHLPFATIEETKYRAVSMYLMAQYFLFKEGEEPDWELKHLADIYDDIKLLNMNFSQRLSSIGLEDATLNALVELDCFAENIRIGLSKDKLTEIKALFKSYLDKNREKKKKEQK